MNTRTLMTPRRWPFAAAFIALLVAVTPDTASAQAAVQKKYERAQAREKTARAADVPVLTTLRSVATAYELIVRQHPRSGYSDNALWQAAGLLETAYGRSKSARDRDGAKRLLTWLKREYPTSALARQVDAKLAALVATAVPAVATAVAAPESPAPAGSRTPVTPAAPVATTTKVTEPTAISSKPLTPVTSPRPAAAQPAPATAASPVSAAMSVRAVTQSALPKGDRLIFELGSEMPFTATRVSNPDRIVIDIPNAQASSTLASNLSDVRGMLVKAASVTRSSAGSVRIMIDLSGSPRFSTFPLYSPFRLVVDVEGEAVRPAPVASAPAPQTVVTRTAAVPAPMPIPALETRPLAPPPAAPSITSRGDYSLARQLGLTVSRIVIDPGHGGHDPGAKANGLTEAGLVLDVALRLEKLLLDKPGFEVVLTRRTDEFIPLEARTALANREAADLFISIHANSARAAAQGVETYFLDFASNPQAEALAARENATSAQAMHALPTILRAIATNNKLDESRELARTVQTSLVRSLSANRQSGKDLGVKRAPFVVLIGAQMPSVLSEISFITNKAEASLLKQTVHRQKIAQALADAIVRYQGSLKKVQNVAVNATPGAQ